MPSRQTPDRTGLKYGDYQPDNLHSDPDERARDRNLTEQQFVGKPIVQ